MPRLRTLPAALLLAAITLTGTACASTSAGTTVPADAPGDDGQTVADACALVRGTVDEALAGVDLTATDPAAALAGAQEAASRLLAAVPEVTNDEVAAAVGGVAETVSGAVESLQAVSGGDLTRLPELATLAARLQEGVTRVDTLCGG